MAADKAGVSSRRAGAVQAGGSGGIQQPKPFMPVLGVWALGVGTAIGWGSLVVTSSQYLLQAGPLGSVLGIIAGTIVMLVIAKVYGDMIARYPDAGGSYTFVRHILGYDFGFVLAWFLVLTYLAVFWANATSLPLFSRFFLSGFFERGYLYSIFGYDVYAGEILLTMCAVVVMGVLCMLSRRANQVVMIVLVLLFTVGITACFVACMLSNGNVGGTLDPALLPDRTLLAQVSAVAFMTPWAFIGFESVSHSAPDFSFPVAKTFRVLVAVVLTTAALYVLVTLLSVTAYPDRYDSWFAYLSDLGNLSGIEGIPPFFAAYRHLGSTGVGILMAALLALVLSSLIGNMVALGKLIVALSRDGLMPERFAQRSPKGSPQAAIVLVMGISLLMPFLGRTPIGWIVDITTIGACVVYGFVSASEFKVGRSEGSTLKVVLGAIGLVSMLVLALVTVAPSLVGTGSLAQETYLLVTIWAVLGFVYFRIVLNRDEEGAYGKSVVVWVLMLSLVLFTATAWMQQSNQNMTSAAFDNIQAHLEQTHEGFDFDDDGFIQDQLDGIRQASVRSSLVMVALFALAMGMMMSNYRVMRNRQEQIGRALGEVKEIAYTDPLTGVKSKSAYVEFERKLDGELADGSAEDVAVVVCDVNGLKFVNDTYGHKAGDDYIKAACMIVCRHFEHSPVFRVGGDEFVAILVGDDFECRDSLMEALNAEIEANIGTGNAVISAGISAFKPGVDQNIHDAFERADAHMYQRKMQLKEMGVATRD